VTVEVILLLCIFVFTLFGVLTQGPTNSFLKSGPRLGARVERQLITGDGFIAEGTAKNQWKRPPK
jgi:hypothetical protein